MQSKLPSETVETSTDCDGYRSSIVHHSLLICGISLFSCSDLIVWCLDQVPSWWGPKGHLEIKVWRYKIQYPPAFPTAPFHKSPKSHNDEGQSGQPQSTSNCVGWSICFLPWAAELKTNCFSGYPTFAESDDDRQGNRPRLEETTAGSSKAKHPTAEPKPVGYFRTCRCIIARSVSDLCPTQDDERRVGAYPTTQTTVLARYRFPRTDGTNLSSKFLEADRMLPPWRILHVGLGANGSVSQPHFSLQLLNYHRWTGWNCQTGESNTSILQMQL